MDNYGSKWELFILLTIYYRIAHLSVDVVVGEKPSTLQLPKLEETQSERARENRSRTYQLAESNYCFNVCSNRNFVDCKARPCTLGNFTLHCSVALCLHQIQIEIAVNRLICRKKYVSLHIINNE